MPIGGNNRLDVLWPLGKALLPRQARLRGKPCHGLNQLLHLVIEQMLAIAGLNGFDLIRCAEIPVLNHNGIGGPMHREPEIVRCPAEDQIKGINAGTIHQCIGIARRRIILGDLVLPFATVNRVDVVARPAFKRIVATPADQRVVASTPLLPLLPVRTLSCPFPVAMRPPGPIKVRFSTLAPRV